MPHRTMLISLENLAIAYFIVSGISLATALLFLGFFIFLPISSAEKRAYLSFSLLALSLGLVCYCFGRIYALPLNQDYFSLNFWTNFCSIFILLFLIRFSIDLLKLKNKYWSWIFPLVCFLFFFSYIHPPWVLTHQSVAYSIEILGISIEQKGYALGPIMTLFNLWAPINVITITIIWIRKSFKDKFLLLTSFFMIFFVIVGMIEIIEKYFYELETFQIFSGPTLFYFAFSPFFFLMAAKNFNNVMEINRSLKEKSEELIKINQEMRFILNTISHDIVGPLVGIHGFTDLIEEQEAKLTKLKSGETNDPELDKKYAHYVERIRINADHMKTLLGDLAEYVQIGKTEKKLTVINFADILKTTLSKFTEEQNGIEINLDKIVEISGEWPTEFLGSTDRIKQIFHNLIDNSLKYTNPQSLQIKIHGSLEEQGILFSVSDNGPGVPTELHQKVFDVFFRNDRGTRGTGMGLPIVRKITETYLGKVWMSPNETKGTTVNIKLPYLNAQEHPWFFTED